MRSILVKIGVNAAAIWVATLVIPGVTITGDAWTQNLLTLLVVGAIFGLINAFIKPVVMFFSIPFIILTLGLFVFVVNAIMLQIVSWVSDWTGLSFHIDDFFWSAIGAAVVVTFVSMLLNLILPDGEKG